MTERFVLLSLDGLSSAEYGMLGNLMPKTEKIFSGQHAKVDSTPFSAPQAIWAELLTGTPWHENGCSGYAFPDGSLNRLSVFAEDNLLVPANFAIDSASTFCSNVPLLLPKRRSWLSDGSLPLAISATPGLARFFEGGYKPRPYSSLPTAMIRRAENAANAIHLATDHLKSLDALLSEHQWQRAIIRLSIFDQLHHLCGPDFLYDEDLYIRKMLITFLSRLDQFISNLAQRTLLSLFSGYSHVRCKARLNVNAVLAHESLLKISDKPITSARQNTHRLDAFAALSGLAVSANSLLSTEGRIDHHGTSAAAPLAGCVYINRSSAFLDGTVNDGDFIAVVNEVKSALQHWILKQFGTAAKIIEKPASSLAAIVPDFIVSIQGVEYFDTEGHWLDSYNVPVTCHSSEGFFASAHIKLKDQRMSPRDVNRTLVQSQFARD